MSGPKVSRYEVSKAQQARLAEERRKRERELAEKRRQKQLALAEERRRRQEEERKRKEEEKKRRKLLSDASLYADKIEQELENARSHSFIIEECASTLSDDSLVRELHAVEQQAESLRSKIASIDPTSTSDQLETLLSPIIKEVESFHRMSKTLTKHVEDAAPNLKNRLSDSIDSLFAQPVQTSTQTAAYDDSEQFDSACDKLDSLLSFDFLPPELNVSLRVAKESLLTHKDKGDVSSFIAIELQPLLKECEHYSMLWQEYGGEYSELNNMYQVLIDETHSRSECGDIPFSEHAILQLNRAIAELQAKAQEQAEKAYIVQSIAEVMEEMGYDILGDRSIVRRSGTRYRNELYRFGNETAISVTYSDAGQITMELGKVDRCDRAPSLVESERLAMEMEVFCQQFQSVEARLSERGVLLRNRISILPPSQEFAQIININDYHETQKIEEKRKRSKAQSVLYAETKN